MTNPAGFKTFADDVILTATEINGYLMQGILVFNDSAARDTALSGSLAEGRYCYLKDTNTTYVYTGSSWEAVTGSSSPTVSGTTGSPTTSSITLDGVSGTLYDFGSNGSITTTAGRARVLIIGGGSQDSGPNYGNAGDVFAGWIDLTAATHTITVGAIGTGGSPGGDSRVGTLRAAAGGIRTISPSYTFGSGRGFGVAQYAGTSDDITGSTVIYAGATGSGATTYGSTYSGPAAVAGRVFIFIPN